MASRSRNRRNAACTGSSTYARFDFLGHAPSRRSRWLFDLGHPSGRATKLMRDLSELNINEGGKPVQRPAPTRKAIEAFQTHFGITLPEEYLHLLRHSNGGHPELDSVEPIGRPGAARWSVNRFYHLDDNDKVSTTSLWVVAERWCSMLGKDALPFAADGGGNQFFLDLKTSPAAVKVCIHDEGFSIVDIAPSLELFIDSLSVDPDMV